MIPARRVQISMALGLMVALFAVMIGVNARLSWRPSTVDFGAGVGSSAPNHVRIAWRGGELWFLSPLYGVPIDPNIKGFGQPNINPARNWNRAPLPLVLCQSLQQGPDGMGALCAEHNLFALAKSGGTIQIWRDEKMLRAVREAGHIASLPITMVSTPPDLLSISPDGTRIVSGSYLQDKGDINERANSCMFGLVLFDVSSGKQIARQGAIEGAFADVAWSPDSRELAGLTLDGWVFILDAHSGNLKSKFRAHHLLAAQVVWSPDGKTIVTATNPRVCLTPKHLNFDFKTGDPFIGGGGLHIVGEDGKMELDISPRPDGETKWNGRTERSLKRFDARTGQQIGSALPLQTGASDMAFSPDGSEIALGEHDFALILDARTLKTKRRLNALPAPLPSSVPAPVCVAWSQDGATLATSTVRGLNLWRVR